jgi:putative spermidine/putrescine transport system permease protein
MSKQKLAPYVLVLPFVLIMAFIFAGGLYRAVVQSLGYMPAFGMHGYTLQYYRQVLGDTRFINSLVYTFYIAFVSSTLSVIMGVVVAFVVHKTRRGNKFSFTLYKIPIIVPHLVVIILVMHIFFQTGIISRLAFALGIIDDPINFPLLIYDRGGIGIMLVYLYKQIPFVVLTVFTVLRNLDRKYVQIAENLGASPFQTLTRVTLPLLVPAMLSAFLITFAFGFGAFEVPFILGSPAQRTLPLLAYYDYTSIILADRPIAMATNVIISVISLLLIWLYMRLVSFLTKRGLEGGIF